MTLSEAVSVFESLQFLMNSETANSAIKVLKERAAHESAEAAKRGGVDAVVNPQQTNAGSAQICPQCNGAGWYAGFGTVSEGDMEPTQRQCEQCNGTGKLQHS